MKYDNERQDKDWINPPEPREEVELDVDSINDDKWLREREQKDSSFPWYDMWGSMTVDEDFEGMHPNKLIDFHIYREEDDDTKHIVFYGWDKKYQQVDIQNVIGHYELINVEDKDET